MRAVTAELATNREPKPWFSLAVTALFVAALVVVHGYHELWRDEMSCWIMARNSDGLADLLTGVRRYEGHPILWYYVLYLASRISRSVVLLHGTTIAMAGLSAYLWLRDAPLARIVRVALLPTYLFFYEYGVLSRSYTLGILLLFLFCRLYRRQRLRVVILSGLLVLLVQTSAYDALIAVALGLLLYLQSLADLRRASAEGRSCRRDAVALATGIGMFCAGLAFSWATTFPPADGHYAMPGMLRRARVWPTLPLRYWLAIFPRANPGNGSWPVTAAVGDDWSWLAPWLPALAVAVFLLWILALRKVPRVALTYALGVLAMAAFQRIEYAGFIRHWGHYFILLVACIWLYLKQPAVERPGRLMRPLLAATLMVQIIAAVVAVRAEIRLPFSGSLEAARFLRSQGLADAPMVGSFDHAVSAVTGYLDRPFRSAESYQKITSVVFEKRVWPMGAPPKLAFDMALIEAKTLHTPTLVIQNIDIGSYARADAAVERLHVTQPAIVSNEQFWIYRVTPKQ